MDAAAELGRNPISKHHIRPEYGDEQTGGLMEIPTRVNTEDETHLGLQQARGGINPVVTPLVSLGLHGG